MLLLADVACGSHVFNNQVLTLMCSQPCHLHLSKPFHHRAGGTAKRPHLFPRVQRAVCGCATPTPRLHSDRGWGCLRGCSTLPTGLRPQVQGEFSTANSPGPIPAFSTDPLRILRKDPGGSRVGSGGCGARRGRRSPPSRGSGARSRRCGAAEPSHWGRFR